jgi:hypothetical protein
MTTHIDDFFTAWSIADDTTRDAQVADTLSDDIFYVDPRTADPLTTVAAVKDYIGQFSKMAPGMPVSVVNTSKTLTFARATVQFGEGEQSQMGQYTVDLGPEGKIQRMIGFVGLGTPT